MKVLLDTHIAIWSVTDDPKLPQKARDIITTPGNQIYYSVGTIWEVTIKHQLHPETFLLDGQFLAEGCDDNGFVALPVLLAHVYQLHTLKRSPDAPRHKDPFDRILLAQAKAEEMLFLTHDSLMADYNEPLVLSV